MIYLKLKRIIAGANIPSFIVIIFFPRVSISYLISSSFSSSSFSPLPFRSLAGPEKKIISGNYGLVCPIVNHHEKY